MAQVHDKFVIELAEVIKGYGNDPDIDDPFHLSEFYRFYELPEIAVSANHFRTMISLELEIAKAIEHLQSAQPERKNGHWTEKEVMYIKDTKDAIDAWQSCKCSECGRYDTRPYMYFFVEPMFCSYCGAEMKKGESDGENRSN